MIYLIVFLMPFIGPFYRAQPFLGAKYIAILSVILGIIYYESEMDVGNCFLFYAVYVLIAGFWQVQLTWNYRRHGMCIYDHI
jgi:hypothetical protein